MSSVSALLSLVLTIASQASAGAETPSPVEAGDLAKQVIAGDMPLEAEAVEQRLPHHPPLAHHPPNLLRPAEEISAPRLDQAEFFNAIRRLQPSASRRYR